MIELELLGANGDSVVMTDARGTRYNIVVDDALRAAVRRERPSARPPVRSRAPRARPPSRAPAAHHESAGPPAPPTKDPHP